MLGSAELEKQGTQLLAHTLFSGRLVLTPRS